ncbi:MAG: tRNA (N6-threonylcarbamoyladenosine(37)-N6)-methyltransferase TrmO [Peptococcaceae bacterium]|jgi:tRNA-Thr(GGU) m(6)t(6)A37 methyltransferase TsaA|nr:tRNA (N6-threonylcarbamoyladenosine(37)-N6)-methyltransferase TrmO [Peptococcaceae bacterium]
MDKGCRVVKIIARIYNDFPEKFGVPRQSGLVPELRAKIVFEPEYRNPDALKGLEGYSHIWLIWQFSEAVRDTWSPTVRPPRLGGEKRQGVFATRSPFRPNPIGLSSVKLEEIKFDSKEGPVLYVTGADLMNGTPIYDIKPYLPFTDCHTDAVGGFADAFVDYSLDVVIPDDLLALIPAEKHKALIGVLAQDPRPSYHDDPTRVYGITFGMQNIKFRVNDMILTVVDVENL